MGDSEDEDDYYGGNQTSNGDSDKYTYGSSHGNSQGGEGGDDDDEEGDVDAVEESEPLDFNNDIAVLKARWIAEKEEVREMQIYILIGIWADIYACIHTHTYTHIEKCKMHKHCRICILF